MIVTRRAEEEVGEGGRRIIFSSSWEPELYNCVRFLTMPDTSIISRGMCGWYTGTAWETCGVRNKEGAGTLGWRSKEGVGTLGWRNKEGVGTLG